VAKRRTWALIALAGGTALLAYFAPQGAEPGLQAATAGAGSTAPQAGFAIPDKLPKRRAIRTSKKDLFWAPPPPPPPPAAPEAPLRRHQRAQRRVADLARHRQARV
jgi:hypothetical protein